MREFSSCAAVSSSVRVRIVREAAARILERWSDEQLPPARRPAPPRLRKPTEGEDDRQPPLV